jgi:hypothetical protein
MPRTTDAELIEYCKAKMRAETTGIDLDKPLTFSELELAQELAMRGLTGEARAAAGMAVAIRERARLEALRKAKERVDGKANDDGGRSEQPVSDDAA